MKMGRKKKDTTKWISMQANWRIQELTEADLEVGSGTNAYKHAEEESDSKIKKG